MFTGLISDVGTVERVAPRQGGARLTLRPRSLAVGAVISMAAGAVCLALAGLALRRHLHSR